MLFTDGISLQNTSVDKIKQLIGQTDCITSYPDPDEPETGRTLTVSEAQMCGIDLADFLAERNIFVHIVGLQLGKGWKQLYRLIGSDRYIYEKDGIFYYFSYDDFIPSDHDEPVPEDLLHEIVPTRDYYMEDRKGTMENKEAVKFLKRLASVYKYGERSFYRTDTVDDLLKIFDPVWVNIDYPILNVTTIGNGMVNGCGINCGEDCSETYAPREKDYSVTLTATPKKSSIFMGWNGDCSGTTNPITVNMNYDEPPISCTAAFVDTFSSNLPVACQLYGVQDNGLNDTQFFTVNPESLEVNALGESLPGYDIEALDIHPNTGELYAASGDDTDKPGRLYTVDTQTGALNDLGYTGFDEIEGLSFHADTLWAWAKGDGLVSINLQNGATGTLVFPSPVKVEDLTWNNEATLLYAAQDTTLWVSDGQSVEQACDLPGHTEAIEMLPGNFLLLGIHGNRNILNFKVMDLATCNLLPGIGIPTDYNDIEGIAWPTNACAGGGTTIDEELGKSMVSEAMMLFFGIKTGIETFHADEGVWPATLADLWGVVTEGTYVKETVYTYDVTHPQIVMTIDKFESSANQVGWKMIDRTWSCKASENGGLTTIPNQYLPISCQ